MEIPGYHGNLTWLGARTVLLTRHGSHAYGLATPESDLDIKGVAAAPRAYVHGCYQRFEQAECSDPDLVIFELRKFIALAADCNPNILEVLFTHPDDHLGVHPIGERLLAARRMFVSRKARHTFTGYAMAQFKRLDAHHRWIVAPPDATRAPGDFESTAAYEAHRKDLAQYEAWQRGRNPRRAALEAAYGYDTKFGGHVVRLMRMAREILTTGEVIVRRPDRDELLAIRRGAWPFERLKQWTLEQDAAMDDLERASTLPRGPDREALDALCIELVEESLRSLPE